MAMSRTQSPKAVATAAELDGTARMEPRGPLRRWLTALVDARMQKVERDVRERLRFASDDVLRRAGYRRRD
jgi:hypothetical protein